MATEEKTNGARILFVQAGDYREAFYRLRNGGAETYYAQQFTVNYVGELTRTASGVGVLSHAAEVYAELLPNGVMSYGLPLWKANPQQVLAHLEAFGPTHLVLRVPILYVLDWALAHGVTTLPLLAESFSSGDARMAPYYAKVQSRLNHPAVRWIANHNEPACLSLVDLGIDARKIIPYDYEHSVARTPDAYPPRQLTPDRRPFRLLLVGSLSVEKGLTDCIHALQWLRDRGTDATLTLAGPGNVEFIQELSHALGLGAYVTCLGIIPNSDVIPLMQEHDAVLVPSRHEYPEGLPLTLYEALCARTPVIVSDHPVLKARIRNRETGLVFEAGNAAALGTQVITLLSDPVLYADLSEASRQAWQQLQCPVKWGELLDRFIRGTPEDGEWLDAHTLSNRSSGSSIPKHRPDSPAADA